MSLARDLVAGTGDPVDLVAGTGDLVDLVAGTEDVEAGFRDVDVGGVMNQRNGDLLTDGDRVVFERPYTFLELPESSLSTDGGRIRPTGLARLLPAPRLGRRGPRTPLPQGCQLPRLAHAHVYSVALDFNLVRGDGLNWAVQLDALATAPDRQTVEKLQRRLADLKPSTTPDVTRGMVRCHRLIWTDGSEVPVSRFFERCHVVLPVIGLIHRNINVAVALAQCLRNPDRGLESFLLACLMATNLKEQRTLIGSATDPDAARAILALFGDGEPAQQTPAIVAVASP